jgi:predicted O-methyltransferase YrrM
MTREFFDLSLPLLSPNGLIILDDAIKYRWKMEGFHEYLDSRGISYELVQTDEDDGVMVIA